MGDVQNVFCIVKNPKTASKTQALGEIYAYIL